MAYNWVLMEPDDTPRNLAALLVGVAVGAGGPLVPLVAVLAGLVIQSAGTRYDVGVQEHVVDGVVDGGIAVLARAVVESGTLSAARARIVNDADAFAG